MKIDETGAFSQYCGFLPPHLMKVTVLAENSSFINFHRDLSADISQVGVAFFPYFPHYELSGM